MLKFINSDKKLYSSGNEVPFFSLEGKIKKCKVVDVYDGDTCKVIFYLNNNLFKWNVRMIGYDSPEMKPSRKLENRQDIILKAKAARDYLKSLVMNDNQLVYIKCHKFDKYGRLLGELLLNKNDNISVNQMMISNKYGYIYDGGKKHII